MTREAELLPLLLPSLQPEMDRLVRALKRCNQKLFLRELAAGIDTLDSVRSQVSLPKT